MQTLGNYVRFGSRVATDIKFVALFVALSAIVASVVYAESAVVKPVDSRLHPGEARVLNLDPQNFKETLNKPPQKAAAK